MRASSPVQLLIVGSPGRARSEIGLALARTLHRPFIDTGHPEGAGDTDESNRSAELDRLDRLLAVSTAAVIAAPRVVLDPGSHGDESPRRGPDAWVLLVDDSSDRDTVDELSTLADAVLPASTPIDDVTITRLVEEFRDATRRPAG